MKNYKLSSYSEEICEVEQELYTRQKELFDLVVKKRLNKNFKVHLYKKIKKEIAKLKFTQGILVKKQS